MATKRNITPQEQTEASLIRSSFGEVLRRQRVSAGYDQRPFSRAVGISNSHLRKIESGEVSPTLITVFKIANVLDVDPSSLVSQTNTAVRSEHSEHLAH